MKEERKEESHIRISTQYHITHTAHSTQHTPYRLFYNTAHHTNLVEDPTLKRVGEYSPGQARDDCVAVVDAAIL